MAKFPIPTPKRSNVFSIADFSGIDETSNLPDKTRALNVYNYKTEFGLVTKREGVEVVWNREREDKYINFRNGKRLLDIFKIDNERVLSIFVEYSGITQAVDYKFYIGESFNAEDLQLIKTLPCLYSEYLQENEDTNKIKRYIQKIRFGNMWYIRVNLDYDMNNDGFRNSSSCAYHLLLDTNKMTSIPDIIKEIEPYVPTILISRNADGTGGVNFEPTNMFTDRVKISYLGEAYTLSYVVRILTGTEAKYCIGPDEVIIKKLTDSGAWTTLTEISDYTLNRATGVITFVAAPGVSPVDGRDNIEIEFELVEGFIDVKDDFIEPVDTIENTWLIDPTNPRRIKVKTDDAFISLCEIIQPGDTLLINTGDAYSGEVWDYPQAKKVVEIESSLYYEDDEWYAGIIVDSDIELPEEEVVL